MLKSINILLFLLGSFAFSFGQNPPSTPSVEDIQQEYESKPKKAKTQEEKALETATKMSTELKLNEDQKNKIYSVVLKTEKEISNINKSKMPVREKSMAINKANKERLNAYEKIMTPQQFKAYRLSFP